MASPLPPDLVNGEPAGQPDRKMPVKPETDIDRLRKTIVNEACAVGFAMVVAGLLIALGASLPVMLIVVGFVFAAAAGTT